MNILITGGTGFIGRKLCDLFIKMQYCVYVLTRNPDEVTSRVKAIRDLSEVPSYVVFDVVINLAGEPIADKRWSELQKSKIIESRIKTTQQIVNYLVNTPYIPQLLISASAIGYYGVSESNMSLTEDNDGDESFSSKLCQEWEKVAKQAEVIGIRTCLLRTGIVLGKGGGALDKMLTPFKLGLGGKIGKGSQWMSWIHIDDLVGIILYCIEHDDISGPVNGTAPNPVTNSDFTHCLGRALNRPTIFSMPTFVIEMLMGQMGEELLLSGKKVIPDKIIKHGYKFKYTQLEKALSNVI